MTLKTRDELVELIANSLAHNRPNRGETTSADRWDATLLLAEIEGDGARIVVPVEPTGGMQRAADNEDVQSGALNGRPAYGDAHYSAMLAASPFK